MIKISIEISTNLSGKDQEEKIVSPIRATLGKSAIVISKPEYIINNNGEREIMSAKLDIGLPNNGMISTLSKTLVAIGQIDNSTAYWRDTREVINLMEYT